MPSPRRHLEIVGHERTRMLEEGMQQWLQHRRAIADLVRKAGTLDELAKRRGRMNPRLSHEWLKYLVTVGGRHDDDGWRWKIDPQLRFGGFGPWRHTWSLAAMHALSMPVLGILGTEMEEMGWGITADQLRPFLPSNVRLEEFKGVGHFIHIEKPRECADLVLEFLVDDQAHPRTHHARAARAARERRRGPALLHLHGSACVRRTTCRSTSSRGPVAIYALDFTGHGDSTSPKGGGYTPELLMGDVDAAINHIGDVRRSSDAASARTSRCSRRPRATTRCAARSCATGPACRVGARPPGRRPSSRVDPSAPVPPDPFALAELSKDVRPPDYAVDFVRLVLAHTQTPNPIAVCAKARPEWLTAVLDELGAAPVTIAEALRLFA